MYKHYFIYMLLFLCIISLIFTNISIVSYNKKIKEQTQTNYDELQYIKRELIKKKILEDK